jgi:hypothetical protein
MECGVDAAYVSIAANNKPMHMVESVRVMICS